MTNRDNKLGELYLVFNQEKIWLLIISVLFVVLGITAIFLPFVILGSVTGFIGVFVIMAGTVEFIEGCRQLFQKRRHWGNFLLNFGRGGLDIVLAFFLFNYFYLSIDVLISILGFLFAADGLVQIIAGASSRFIKSKIILFCSGLIMILFGFVIALELVRVNVKILGTLLGIKLILFGFSVIFTLARNHKINSNLLLRSITIQKLPKIRGAAYAAYFGGGFHVGIYVGNNDVVHFKANNLIIKTSWNDFFEGRAPQLWEYPDIKRVDTEKIINLALSYVGKKLPYKFLKNNCEHFVIYCLSGGKTTRSQYAQDFSSLINIRSRPFIGTFMEFYLRIVEWLIFNLGGKFGRRISLRIRKMSALLTSMILSQIISQPQDKNKKTSR